MMQSVVEEIKKEGLRQDEISAVEKTLISEIGCVLGRNINEKFLRSVLTRILILEELNK